MSKIARIYQGTNEIQKYYQGGVLQRLFFDWKHYIGEEINIEYAKECAGRNVMISGKTYQNLFKATLNQGAVDNALQLKDIRVHSENFYLKVGKYTITMTDENIEIALYPNYLSTNSSFISWTNCIVWDNTSEGNNIKLAVRKKSQSNITVDEVIGKVILLEGDYTNIDLPNSIDGIESIGEREDNLVTIRNYNYKCDTDNVVLPDGTKNSIETIDGKKVHVQRVWKSPQISIDIFQGSQNTSTSHEFTFNIKKPASVLNIKKVLYDKEFFYLNDNTKKHRITISFPNNYICLWVRVTKEEFPTQQDVRYFFKNNPMYIYYELKEPIYTYLESGLYDDITIPTSNIKNEIYLENGKWYHKRNIGKVVFDGSDDEGWGYSENPKRFTTQYIQNAKYKNVRTPVHADGYTFSEVTGENFDKLAFLYGNSIFIYNYDYTTVDDFKAYLAENPLEVYYELAEPVISELPFSDITYKLNEPIRSLTDKIYDYVKEGKIVRKIGKYTFTNKNYFSNPFGNGNPNNGTKLFETTIIPPKTSKIICDKFNYVGWGDISDTSKIAIARFTNSGNLIFRHNSASLQEFQNYLLENPVTVYYELATPIETPITPDMILINGEPITDTVGIELPNGTKDSIENDIYTKNINKIVLDGSADEVWLETNWSAEWGKTHNGAKVYEYRNIRGTSYVISTNQNNFLYESTDTTLSPYYETNYKTLPENAFMCKGNYIDFGCHFDTVEDFRNFLAENPFTIQYELMNPIKIPLFSIKEGLTTLKSTNNITPQIELDCLVRDDFQNLCDNEWKTDPLNANNIVTKNFIDVSNATYKKLYLENLNNFLYNKIGIYGYDENGNRLVNWSSFPKPIIMPDFNIKKIKIFISGNDIEPRLYINHNTDKVLGEWEAGYFDNNGETTNGVYMRTKNYFNVLPNTKYKMTKNDNRFWFTCAFFDKDKNFISRVLDMKKELIFTTTENTYFIKFGSATSFPNILDIKFTKIE